MAVYNNIMETIGGTPLVPKFPGEDGYTCLVTPDEERVSWSRIASKMMKNPYARPCRP